MAAYAAGALFAVGLALFALPGTGLGDGTTAGLVLALAPHLVLLAGVWPWPAVPRWASAAGLTWLVLDISSDVLARPGTSPARRLPRVRSSSSGGSWSAARCAHR